MISKTEDEAPFTTSAAQADVRTAKNNELHSNSSLVHVEFSEFYGIEPSVVDRRFDIRLSDLSYLPKVS
jgi:hypothetical protein